MVSTATAITKDAHKGDLVLRIRGTSRHGQIVRLQAAKCTIGSGPRCTLRLRARGVRPLHCLIVRGPAAAVVRRWHPDTRLNGHAFTESLLSTGDRLSVGPLEFEVLESLASGEPSDSIDASPSMAEDAETESTDQDLARLHCQHEELEQRRHELDALATTLNQREQSLTESIARLEAREEELEAHQRVWEEECRRRKAEITDAEQAAAGQQSQLEAKRRTFEEERRQWDDQRTTAEKALATRTVRFETLQAELASQRQALELQRQRKESEEANDVARCSGRLEELSAREMELEAQQRAFEELRQRWEAERSDSETQFHARQEELNVHQAEYESRQRVLEEQRQRWEAERGEAERDLNARQAELEGQRQTLDEQRQRKESEEANDVARCSGRLEELSAREVELEAQQRAFEELRQRWEAERSDSETQFHTRQEELNVQQAECESRQRALEEQRQRWEAERAEAERTLNARQTELEVQRQTLDEQRQRQEAESDEVEKELVRRREELDACQTELEASREAFEDERRQWEAEREEVARREPAEGAEEEAVPAGQPSGQSPLSSLEILRRMGNLPEFPDDEEPRESAGSAVPSPSRTGRPSQETSQRPTHADNEEESIDDYMSRLLQRVRGVAGQTAGAAEPSRSRPKEDSVVRETIPLRPAAEPAAPRPALGKRREPVELSPRTVAPEKFVNLTAMREVANLSAQTAIDCHYRRTLRRVVVSKLIIALLAIVGGCVLLWVWRAVPNRLTFGAAMASFVVALFWGIQYFVLMVPRFRRRREREEGQRTEDEGLRAAEEKMTNDEDQMTKEIENTKHE